MTYCEYTIVQKTSETVCVFLVVDALLCFVTTEVLR